MFFRSTEGGSSGSALVTFNAGGGFYEIVNQNSGKALEEVALEHLVLTMGGGREHFDRA